jgi:nicotinamide-nucleotide amidase
MNVEIITIGDELLIGQVVDTNSAWMANQLNHKGFNVSRITSVSDQGDEIHAILSEALSRVSIVLLTGGLGPTKDDITKQVLCDFFDTRLVFNEQVFADIQKILQGRVAVINELNRQQAMVPEKCKVIQNQIGTAPIMWFEHDGKVVVSMPGVPSEMKKTMTDDVIPELTNRFPTGIILHRTLHVFNIPESTLAEMLSSWEDELPFFIKVAYLPQPGKIRLRLTARGDDDEQLHQAIYHAEQQLIPIIGDSLIAYDDEATEKLIGEKLMQLGHTLATAESCSGGKIASFITAVPGCSNYFKGSVVAYHNQVKTDVLLVNKEILEREGAVSRQVVEQMAVGAQKLLKTHWAVATSGIAGPTGGTDDKPVGTVWIAVAGPDGVISESYFFGPMRERNILRTAESGMVMLLRQLIKYVNK